MVLAAGLGTRLRPLTDYVPKPLLPLGGVPLLDRAVDALTAAGVERIAVNAHHRADRVADHLADRADHQRFHLSVEPAILGTAGAFDGARAFLAAADIFMVFNGDVWCDLDMTGLLTEHRSHGAVATLALVDRSDINTVAVGDDGQVVDVAGRLGAPTAGSRMLTFTGIACYSRAFLDHVPPGRSDLVSALASVMTSRPGSVRALVYDGPWEDLGTLTRYLDAHRSLLGDGFVSAARGVAVPAGADLSECVMLPGATVPAGCRLRRAVLGPGWAVPERPAASPDMALAEQAGFGSGTRLDWITGHGSDRRFVRLQQGERRAVLMRTPPNDPDHERFLAVAGFLYDRGLGAPAILAHDPADRTVLMEDLGEDTLQSLVTATPARAAELYDRVLDRLADLQTFGAEARALCPEAWDRRFDAEHLRWETDYFRQRFLVGHVELDAADLVALTPEFDALAAACLQQPRTLVHRDFQSQNILLKDGMVRLVDVQGMRWGPVAYDAVSLLHDPYVDLDPDLVERLLATFPERVAARGGRIMTADRWRAWCATAALQRLMQALGAFGFLGHVKGRAIFLDAMPAAVSRLRAQLERAADVASVPGAPPPMPRLSALLAGIDR